MQFKITGMSCAACSNRVEKAVSGLENVDSCMVNLLTNSMQVEGNATPEEIIKAVEKAGYGAERMDKSTSHAKYESAARDLEDSQEEAIRTLKKRLVISLGFLAVLMYFSMGHSMLDWPLPETMMGNPMMQGLVQLLLTIIIMVINQKFFISGFGSLRKGAPNMDTLVAMGSGAAFVYSIYVLFSMADAMNYGETDRAFHFLHDMYFESAAMILTLITLGKMLEARAKGKTTSAIKGLMDLSPKTATVLLNGEEKTIPVEQIEKNMLFVVRPGESIPVDGEIIEGESAVDESALTGESVPADKIIGDSIYAGTINCSGFIKCKACKVGEDTTLSGIIQLVSDASASKAPIAKIADKVSGIFVPVVITIAVITTLVWLILGESASFSIARGIAVLVISCPCALGLATPVAIMVGNGVGARNGILFKTAEALENAGKTQIVVLDKTGTVTEGKPKVTELFPAEDISEKELFRLAYCLEKKSEHPLAKAILEYEKKDVFVEKDMEEVSSFQAMPGSGLLARRGENLIFGGNLSFVMKYAKVSEALCRQANSLAKEGKTPLFFGEGQQLFGMIAVADVIKKDSVAAIKRMQSNGIYVVMLTGDNEATANAIGKETGVDRVIAGVLPKEKALVVEKLKEYGKVMMVGDGINDAPALTVADTGVAIGSGTDVSMDAADVVLVKSRLSDIPAALSLSHSVLRKIKQNLFWAFCYNIIGIPLAAGVCIPLWGISLNPMFAAAAMSLSSFCVVSNALLLNLCHLQDAQKDKKVKRVEPEKIEWEEKQMEKKMVIEGMMCGHCEARVKKTLEALEQVQEAIVSHEEGTAIVRLTEDISDEKLKAVIEEQDYKVISVE